MSARSRSTERRSATAGPRADHYSYAVYADAAMAEAFDALRFAGPIGRLIADTQEQVIAEFLAPVAGRTVLDVGTGTGRAAIALAARGALVTGVDASPAMLAVAERRAAAAGVTVTFTKGDAHALAFPDRSFDAVVCLRVLLHTPGWKPSLAELCRIARTRIVFDYPALSSAAAIQAAIRRLAHALGATTEAYRVFSDRAIRASLAANHFRIVGMHRQFVLPIALHKRLGSAAATRRIERALSRVGLTRLAGSPVTVVAERCES
jgi:2-polyprenyl-3-methyl-5-hydroxy-6-metoxy-1,4-benzoquinol methylase